MYLQHEKSTIDSKPDPDEEIKCKNEFMNNAVSLKRFSLGEGLIFSTLPDAHRATQVILQQIKKDLINRTREVLPALSSSTPYQELYGDEDSDESY